MTVRKLRVLALLAAPLLAATFVGAEIIDDNTPVPPVGTLGGPTTALSGPELDQWIRGRKVFDKDWRLSEGLGTPELNADSCRSCHQGPVIGGAGGLDVNVFRFARDFGGTGPFTDLPGGQVASKLRRMDVAGREEVATVADVFEQRQTPIVFGLGLIDTISDATILANEDPNDIFPPGGDGVAGTARMHLVDGVLEVGKFGWKGQIPQGSDFVRDALGGEIGLTVPPDNRGFGILTDNDGVGGTAPDISPTDLADLTFYSVNLAPPPRAGGTDPAIALGEALFTTVGCASCHIPELPGSNGPVPLFSDLLIHNIHPSTFRGMEDPGAPVGFFRTPALWGLRISAPYLHDGSATTIEDAILRHDGEALGRRQEFEALDPADRAALLMFLSDL